MLKAGAAFLSGPQLHTSGVRLRYYAQLRLLASRSAANCSYLREYKALGTAGGLYHFRDAILRAPVPDHIFICNIDICSTFPFEKMLDVHTKHRGVGTIMGVPVSLSRAQRAPRRWRAALGFYKPAHSCNDCLRN